MTDEPVTPDDAPAGELSPQVKFTPVTRGEGVTDAERYLQRLCERSFLKLWSYPGVYRDQGVGQRKEGKEVCDLLVVFGDDIIIFSDKRCAFPDSGDLSQDWSRWFRKAVMRSAEQIWGAERWILDHPDRLYLDRACTSRFPIALPNRGNARIHRIVVAHGVSARCRACHGGTGTLMVTPAIVGEHHYGYPERPVMPFVVGELDTTRGYVHVLDDQALDVLLGTLDTVSDFVTYLTRKEDLVRSGKLIAAAGEDELLAVYLTHFDGKEHHFPVPEGATGVLFDEGYWADFAKNPQRLAQLSANEISYTWDGLIEEFAKHMLAGTSAFRSHDDVREVEPALRYMAAEARTRRRMLATALMDLLQRAPTPGSRIAVRVAASNDPSDPAYVFLTLEPDPEEAEDEYRRKRRDWLEAYCFVARYLNSKVPAVVGLAMEPGLDRASRSEDVLVLESKDWSPEAEARARYLHEEVGLLRKRREHAYSVSEFPEVVSKPSESPTQHPAAAHNNTRNKPCPCGSGKKYKKCCGSRAG
jgi:hypothetical protein